MMLFSNHHQIQRPERPLSSKNAFVSWYYKPRSKRSKQSASNETSPDYQSQWCHHNSSATTPPALKPLHLAPSKKLVRNIKRDEQEGIVFPLAYDPDTGNLAYDLKLLSTGGRRQFDTNAIIQRYDQRIAMSILADFILLGHQATGNPSALSVKDPTLPRLALSMAARNQ